METLPQTFEEYLDQIAQTRAELSDVKKVRSKSIFAFAFFTVSLLGVFIISCTNQNLDTFFKRILFTVLVCGSVIAVRLICKKFAPIAMQYVSNSGCLTGCLGFLFYLIKKTFLYALLAAAIYWFSMLILDELFGLYRKLNIDSDWAMLCIIVLSVITLVSYIRCVRRLIISVKHCKHLTIREKQLEEFYREHSLDLIHTSTTQS